MIISINIKIKLLYQYNNLFNKMSEVDILKYRDIALYFINNNKQNLISIYLKHSKDDKDKEKDKEKEKNNECEGILLIDLNNFDFDKKNKIDVSYIELKLLDKKVIKEINKCKENNNENIIYFVLVTPFEYKIVEIDIRTLMT